MGRGAHRDRNECLYTSRNWIIQFIPVNCPQLAPSNRTDGKTLPDRIAEHFIARIFTGELRAGERLPPDRDLAAQLGVDRTSLRMAMQQLSRMGLIRAVRGSGVTVLDYREHGGLDFLAAVFALPGLSLGGAFLEQVLDDWLDLMPVIVGRAFRRATRDDHRELDALIMGQLALLDSKKDVSRVAALEVALQDRVMRLLGNTSLVLLGNSSRPLRMKLVTLYFEVTDVRSHVESQRALLRRGIGGSLGAEQIATSYREYLRERTVALRLRLQSLPVNPSRSSPRRRSRPS